jgi:hypothetical protein
MADVIEIEAGEPADSFLSWRGIVAGAVAGSAVTLVLASLGVASGLSLVSPWPGQSYTGLAASVAAASALIATIGSFLVAGFVAARVRSRVADVPQAEVEFRDGLQGMVTRAVCVLIGAIVAAGVGSAALKTGSEVARFADKTSTPLASIVSMMVAPTEGKPVAAVQLLTREEARTVEGIFVKSFGSDAGLAPADKTFVANIIAPKAGIPVPEAETRVDNAYKSAVEALDKAKKATALSSLLTGIGLLIGLAAAWFGGVRGGSSRDNNIPGRFRMTGW